MQPSADNNPAEIYATLRRAVLAKQPVAAIYEGRQRFLCPHILGWTEVGLPHLVSYQYGGDSEHGLGEEGSPGNWRCMAVEILRSVELREGPWKTASITVSLILTCLKSMSRSKRPSPAVSRRTDSERFGEADTAQS